MEFGFARSCKCVGPSWEQPDTVTITGPAADSLQNTYVGFASSQANLSSSNTVAVGSQADLGRERGYSCDDLLYFIAPYKVYFQAHYSKNIFTHQFQAGCFLYRA